MSNYNSGTYTSYGDLLAFYDRKRRECPKGVSLKLQEKKHLLLQFVFPDTGKRSSKACNVTFTEKGIIEAIDKAYKVSEALKRFTSSSEFWDWYNSEILSKNTLINDLKTYREIFKEIENNYFNGKNRNTGRKRERDITKPGGISDWSSYNAQYGDYFKLFPNWDKYPEWEEIKTVWFTKEQGTKTFKMIKTALLAIAELTPNNTKLLKQINSIDTTQTKFKEKQSIDLDTFLEWHKKELSTIDNDKFGDLKQSWLWVASMCVLYGLRPSEIAAIQNLTESFTKDNETVYALTDEIKNPNCTLVIGEFTFFGATTKTGFRVVNPVPLKHLWEQLKIRIPLLPEYTPIEGSKPDSVASGFDNKFYKKMQSYSCPVSQKYAFRHLYNQLLEMCGVSTTIRSRLMGHSETTNSGTYKKRRNLKTELDIINNSVRQPLSYDLAVSQLKSLGVDVDDINVKLILKVVYQLS